MLFNMPLMTVGLALPLTMLLSSTDEELCWPILTVASLPILNDSQLTMLLGAVVCMVITGLLPVTGISTFTLPVVTFGCFRTLLTVLGNAAAGISVFTGLAGAP